MRSILTVVTPAASHDLTILATVKSELGIDAGDTSKDALLTVQIRQVSSAIESWCRRVFALETVSETFWPEWNDRSMRNSAPLCLARYPVSEVSEVTLDGGALGDDLYQLDPEGGLLYRLTDGGDPSCWSFCRSAVIAYDAGYELLDGLPHDIEAAAIAWIKDRYYSTGDNSRDPRLRSEQIFDVATFSYFDRAGGSSSSGSIVKPPPDVELMLQPYRRVLIS